MEFPGVVLVILMFNCFFEASSEPTAGQIAVSQVVINRANMCGTTVEEEVFKPNQFSWVNGRKDMVFRLRDIQALSKCLGTAILAYNTPDLTDGATHYHATYINAPVWTKNMKKVAKIGRHVFYKDKNYCKPDPGDSDVKSDAKRHGIDKAKRGGDNYKAILRYFLASCQPELYITTRRSYMVTDECTVCRVAYVGIMLDVPESARGHPLA